MELLKKTAVEIRQMLLKKEVSAQDLVDAAYKRIDTIEEKIGAYNCLTKEYALETAKKVDEKIAKGENLPPLAGIPLALKDNINLKGYKTTASSKILENFVSPYDATVSLKLKENLIPVIGKTNLDEFAMGSSNENSAFKKVHNPYNLNKVPGGSSGGSAASVAALESYLALGSDTGGSIRLPASFCGITGFKPTYGRVSRYGLIAFASSLDQIGPFGRCVEDVANLYFAIAGNDKKDSTSLNMKIENPLGTLKNPVKGLKIGVIKELLTDDVDEDVKNAIISAVKIYEKSGCTIKEISLPLLKHSIGIYYIVATAEASSNLARFDGVKYGYRTKNPSNLMEMYTKTRQEGFGDEVKRRIMLGTYALSSGYYDAYYKKAQQMRRLVKEDFDRAFKEVDLLVSPTCPNTAFELGSRNDDPIKMYLTDVGTICANLIGSPAISIPCGFDKSGMPIGAHLLADCFNDNLLLQAAYNYEAQTEFNKYFAKL
ncbi:MAG: Asp-tRNA(Asn)/Glu-tRNA(Gln) amidotransferase subunit GatA [Candidatus Gastranaerophilales bacterium]|nr:Asp-tRNA(Asn)/Glu-tRNA(Gln) amidotransferase subunit GatA [Candidatus Gastranaerophilales bacterium]